jgi:nicotinate-nucleotide adenylyltransferase
VEGDRLGTPVTLPHVPGAVDLAGATGILGGTFDPPHLGHLAIADDVCETLGLGAVVFMPAGAPPHKADRPISPAADRLGMVELAIHGNPALAVSRVEVDRPGPSYSVDTVAALRADAAKRGDDERFVLIMSGEALSALPTWREPERLLRSCHVAVVERPGFQTPSRGWVEEHFPGLEDRVVLLNGPRLCHSSADIRARVAARRSIRYLVPGAVADYIEEHHLYADQTERSA